MTKHSINRPVHGGNITWAAQLAGCSPSGIVDFSASINPLGPPASAIATIQANLHTLTQYPDPNYTQLRTGLAQIHGISPDWILPGNGAAELLTWASWDLAQLQATYLPTPAFKDYTRALSAAQTPIIPVPLPIRYQAGLTAEDWQAALQLAIEVHDCPPSQAGVLLNTPHNPTGSLLPRDAISPLLADFALVIVDEAFMDFLLPEQDQSVANWVERYPNLVVVRSLTKFYSLPGLRLGYAIAHPDRLKQWQHWRDPWPVNSLAAAVGAAVIQDHSFQSQTWAWLAEARSQLHQGFKTLSPLTPLPGSANFLLIHSQIPVPPLQMALLQQHRILIRDCLSFPELGDRFFRIAVRSQADNQQLLTALSQHLAREGVV